MIHLQGRLVPATKSENAHLLTASEKPTQGSSVFAFCFLAKVDVQHETTSIVDLQVVGAGRCLVVEMVECLHRGFQPCERDMEGPWFQHSMGSGIHQPRGRACCTPPSDIDSVCLLSCLSSRFQGAVVLCVT